MALCNKLEIRRGGRALSRENQEFHTWDLAFSLVSLVLSLHTISLITCWNCQYFCCVVYRVSSAKLP